MRTDDALDRLQAAAIEWAAGARGIVLVDAAAQALADGLDSPALRMLAGATRRTADAEANEWAPATFDELGLEVAGRFAPEAYVDWARLTAQRFLADGGDPRTFAQTVASVWFQSDWSDELSPFDFLEERYGLTEEGYYNFAIADIDAEVVAAARRLAKRPN